MAVHLSNIIFALPWNLVSGSTFLHFRFYTALLHWFRQYISSFSFLYCPAALFWAVQFSIFVSILPYRTVSGSTFLHFLFYTALALDFGQYISSFSFLYCPAALFWAVHFYIFVSILPLRSVSGSTVLHFRFYTALTHCFGQYISPFSFLYCPTELFRAVHFYIFFSILPSRSGSGSTFLHFLFYTALALGFEQYNSPFSFVYCPYSLFRAVHFFIFFSILPLRSVSGSTFLHFLFYTALPLWFGQ